MPMNDDRFLSLFFSREPVQLRNANLELDTIRDAGREYIAVLALYGVVVAISS